jgi:hypothetical protein
LKAFSSQQAIRLASSRSAATGLAASFVLVASLQTALKDFSSQQAIRLASSRSAATGLAAFIS